MSVVNFAGSSLEDENRVRLGSDDGEERGAEGDDERVEKVDEPLLNSSGVLPLRGRTLGFFGPTSRVRLAIYDSLIFPCVAFLLVRAARLTCRTVGQKLTFFVLFFLCYIQASRTLSRSLTLTQRHLAWLVFSKHGKTISYSLFVLFGHVDQCYSSELPVTCQLTA